MADSIEVLRAALRYIEHTANGKQDLLVQQMRNAIRALSPAGGDLHHAVWSMVRPYIQPAAREKVNAALKETLAASPQQEQGAVGKGVKRPSAEWYRRKIMQGCDVEAMAGPLPTFYVCSNPSARHRHGADPMGHCPDCVAQGLGNWSCTPESTTPPAHGDLNDHSGQTLAGAGGDAVKPADVERALSIFYGKPWPNGYVRDVQEKARSNMYRVLRHLTATGAGATGDDSEDAARNGCDAERHEDMSQSGRLRLIAQDDGDMGIMVIEDDGTSATVEFCASGGRSPLTLQALRDLSRAMQADAARRARGEAHD